MANPLKVPSHIVGPFSRPIKWKEPNRENFMLYPKDDENAPDGWGIPFTEETITGGIVDLPMGTVAVDSNGPEEPPFTVGGKKWIKHFYYEYYSKEELEELQAEADAEAAAAGLPPEPVKDGYWTYNKAPGNQVYGNIDWTGPLRDPDDKRHGEKARERLSYFGTPTRYFPVQPEDFTYGQKKVAENEIPEEEPEHNAIYYQGFYLSIAPKPVMGAAYFEKILLDANDNPYLVRYLLCVCADMPNFSDDVYIRLWPGELISSTDIDEKVDPNDPQPSAITHREQMAEMYDEVDNPLGWKKMLTITRESNAYAPETPWFFNTSGLEARAMRRYEDTFGNGQETVTEDSYYLYKLAVTVGSEDIEPHVTFTNIGHWGSQTPGIGAESGRALYTEKVHKWNVYATDPAGPSVAAISTKTAPDGLDYTHEWQVNTVDFIMQQQGKYIACQDYIGNTLINCYLEINEYMAFKQTFMRGVDPDPYYDTSSPTPQNISNRDAINSASGEVFNPPPIPTDFFCTPETTSCRNKWISDFGYKMLRWSDDKGNEHKVHLSVSDAGGGFKPFDSGSWDFMQESASQGTYLTYSGRHRWINYLDLRRKYAVYYEIEYKNNTAGDFLYAYNREIKSSYNVMLREVYLNEDGPDTNAYDEENHIRLEEHTKEYTQAEYPDIYLINIVDYEALPHYAISYPPEQQTYRNTFQEGFTNEDHEGFNNNSLYEPFTLEYTIESWNAELPTYNDEEAIQVPSVKWWTDAEDPVRYYWPDHDDVERWGPKPDGSNPKQIRWIGYDKLIMHKYNVKAEGGFGRDDDGNVVFSFKVDEPDWELPENPKYHNYLVEDDKMLGEDNEMTKLEDYIPLAKRHFPVGVY